MSKQHDEIIEAEIEQTSKNVKYAILFFCVTTLVQLSTMMVYSYSSYMDRKEQAEQYKLNREEQAKQNQVNRQFEILKMRYASQDYKYKEIQYPIIIVRANLEEIYRICSKPLNVDQLKKLEVAKSELEKNRVALIQALGGIQIMFNPDVHSLFANFTSNVEKVIDTGRENPCPSYLPSPPYWRTEYRNINRSMLEEVNKTEKEIVETLNYTKSK